MLRKAFATFGLFAALFALVIAPAQATVTFDPSSGTGFIGRGDVISYLGKSGLVLNPVITFQDTVTYTQTCYKIEKDKDKNVFVAFMIKDSRDFDRTREINETVDSTTRTASGNGNISGYILNGFGGTVSPIPTNLCNEAAWVSTIYSTNELGQIVDSDGIVVDDLNNAAVVGYTSPEPGSASGGILLFNGVSIPY